MSFYQIDSGQLRAKKEELISLNRRFLSEKENLCSKESILRSMWEGAANESFHAGFMKNAGQMDAFAQTIDRYLAVMESIAQRYDNAEQKNIGRAM